MAEVYAAGVDTVADLWIEDRVLRYRPKEGWEAVAVRLGGSLRWGVSEMDSAC